MQVSIFTHYRHNFGGFFQESQKPDCLLAFIPLSSPKLVRVLSAAVNGIETFPFEVQANSGWGDAVVVLIMPFSPVLKPLFLPPETS